ncbi:hypothetical protein AB0L59_16925 [Streptomyces sp. NPDC052109]|uniref:hypothetical protein n=1 Tax=Streptomyces sp. NPDC052109 TaxID=3155527 RepID=UPI0034387320
MRMLQKVVIAAAAVGGLLALGSGSAYAAGYGDSHCGGSQPCFAVGLLDGSTPQAQQPVGKKREAQKRASKVVKKTTVRRENAQSGSTLGAVSLLDGLLELPRQLVGTTSDGTTQNNQANNVTGGNNQNNQAIGDAGGTNQNNQANGPTFAVGLFAPAIQQSNVQQK